MNIETAEKDFLASRLAILESRRDVLLRLPKPCEHKIPPRATAEDPFEFEIRGGYFGLPLKPKRRQESLDDIVAARLEPKRSFTRRDRVDTGRIIKRRTESGANKILTPTRAAKRKAYWDDQQDRTLRRCLRKWGWGCWKRIERSGRLPSEYTAKMIANRARALNLQGSYPAATSEPDVGMQEPESRSGYIKGTALPAISGQGE